MDSIKYHKPVTPLWETKNEKLKEEENWEKQRKPLASVKPALTKEALQWLSEIPEDVKPVLLSENFPHIINLIAIHWKTPFNCNKYLEQLTIRQREGRQGFPPEVFKELIKISLLSTKRNGS